MGLTQLVGILHIICRAEVQTPYTLLLDLFLDKLNGTDQLKGSTEHFKQFV